LATVDNLTGSSTRRRYFVSETIAWNDLLISGSIGPKILSPGC